MLITFKLISNPNHAQLLINLAGGVFILPFLLFSAIAGQLADKLQRVRIIRWIKFSEIMFMLLGAIGFYSSNITLLMMTLFLMGTHSTFFGPIKYSALPDLLNQQELLAGNGLVGSSTFIAILLGTIIGTELGVTTNGALLAASLAIACAITGWITSFFIPQIHSAAPDLKMKWNFLQETVSLIKYTQQTKLLLRLILAISWFWFLGFIFVTQFPVYVKAIIGGNEHIVTLFLVMFSGGIAVGALLCNRLLKGVIHIRYVPLGILGMTLFTLDLCWASSGNTPLLQSGGLQVFLSRWMGWRITLDLFLLSVAGGIYIVPLYALLQAKSEAQFRSRVIACNNIFGALFMVAAALTAMLMVSFGLTTLHIFLITGLVNALVAFLVWKKMNVEGSPLPRAGEG